MNKPPMPSPPVQSRNPDHLHLLTFDVEHWYEGFRHRGIGGWEVFPPRDDRTIERVLDQLAAAHQRSTMFFTGRYAEEFPHVVKRAAQEGHEIASHSYSHTVFPRMKNLTEFREDLVRSISILENLSGCKVRGYRAPKWSIPKSERRAALAVLFELGLTYDSSMFPPLLGRTKAIAPHRIPLDGGSSLWEVPATTCPFLGLQIPVAGGLYFRLWPAWATHAAFASCQRAGRPGMIYLHPYDLDADCPRPPGGNVLFRLLRYHGVATAFDRLGTLLNRYRFVPVLDYLRERDKCPQATDLTSQP